MAAPRKTAKADAEDAETLCPEHFPDGWGDVRLADFASVACEHGQWSRDGEADGAEES